MRMSKKTAQSPRGYLPNLEECREADVKSVSGGPYSVDVSTSMEEWGEEVDYDPSEAAPYDVVSVDGKTAGYLYLADPDMLERVIEPERNDFGGYDADFDVDVAELTETSWDMEYSLMTDPYGSKLIWMIPDYVEDGAATSKMLKAIENKATGKPNFGLLAALATNAFWGYEAVEFEPYNGRDGASPADVDYIVAGYYDGEDARIVYDLRPEAASRAKSAQAADIADVVDAIADAPVPDNTVVATEWDACDEVPGSGITTYVMDTEDGCFSVATEPERVRGVDGYGWTAVDQDGRVVAEGWSEAEYEAAFYGMGAFKAKADEVIAWRRENVQDC